jgi:serine/threonine protein kinase/formylglycine-generating enzyme required for sulfatase activity
MDSSDGTKRDSWKEALAIESICDRFERACRERSPHHAPPRIEDFLGTHREPVRSQLLHRLLSIELDYRRQAGQSPRPEEYLPRFPADGETVLAAFRALTEPRPPQRLSDGQRLGAYIIRDRLGQGGMGAVYRAWDESRRREVALKVIRADRLAGSPPVIRQRWAEQFSREAQAASRLQHPAIVPLLDFGEVEGQPYLAMQLIEGKNLRALQAEERIPVRRAVEIVLAVAEALDCLHQHEIYHCDVKPSNILIGTDGQPYLSDFGLALAEEQIPAEPGLAGTAAYMSPEQARGEGHLVDGRTDIFSLAVVLYELLAGENPFDHPDRQKTLELVRGARVVPLRQQHPEIPEELDRICLRALSRLAADRYSTARDLAMELRAFLDQCQGPEPLGEVSESPMPRIDLKGMAAFGPEDARSYPSLVPGPRTRAGLPVSIASWLDGIAATVRGRAFRVGLIYGPSGSGKSSLVRAGILPRLPADVVAVYVDGSREAEAVLRQLLQARLCAGRESPDPAHSANDRSPGSRRPAVGGFGEVGRPAPSAPNAAVDSESLADLVSAIRRGHACGEGESGKKLLIVIDHFEHWLHSHPQPAEAGLTAALRQCDGVAVQCLLLVREEFRTPAARFLKELDLESSPSRRESLVDLFDLEHARQVLTAMGRSSQALPAAEDEQTDEHRQFLDHAVQLLEHDGRVVPALVAMFVEYMRDKPWTAESLAALGGADSVAAAFFDDLLRRAVGSTQPGRALEMVAVILQALLPLSDTEYQRTVRTEQELFAVAGERRLDQLRAVLDSLCRQARILTLVESPHVAASLRDAVPLAERADYDQANPGLGETGLRDIRYQLAHDSLLPLVRAWLHLKQQERWWGRHVQRMTEHAVTWSRHPSSALLPSPMDWGLQLLADGVASLRHSSPAPASLHRRLMRAATRYYLRRTAWLALLAAITVGPLVWYVDRRQRITQQTAADILLADADHLRAILQNPSSASPAVQHRLGQELNAFLPPNASELAKDAAAGRRANAAAALCLADPQRAGRIWPLLKNAPDPRVRTAVIHHLAPAGVDPQLLIQAYHHQTDAGVRQALLLALGQYSTKTLPPPLRDAFLPTLQADYASHPEAGVHAAIQWLLRCWGRGRELDPLNRQLETVGWNRANAWYHTPSGHLMIVIRGPVEFQMGSPAGEYGRQADEARRRVRIERTFAISATEVTERQFREWGVPLDPPGLASPADRVPKRGNVYWNEAARYCHDLTECEDLSAGGDQRVYLPQPDNPKRYRPVADALRRTGYRLPTEAEWEYACRAGTMTCRFFGETTLYMDSYAWSYDNAQERARPVASLMPNPFGLFDMLGNVSEWCHDVYDRDGDEWSASLRGGSAWSSPVKLRSAARYNFSYRHTDHRVGFRIARTLPEP